MLLEFELFGKPFIRVLLGKVGVVVEEGSEEDEGASFGFQGGQNDS